MKIFAGFLKNKEVFGQLPIYDIKLPSDQWKIVFGQDFPRISHGDILEYEDGSQEQYYDHTNSQCLYLSKMNDSNVCQWSIELTWAQEENPFAGYNLSISNQAQETWEPVWAFFENHDKEFLLQLLDQVINCIDCNRIGILADLRSKWGNKIFIEHRMLFESVQGEEYWKLIEEYNTKIQAQVFAIENDIICKIKGFATFYHKSIQNKILISDKIEVDKSMYDVLEEYCIDSIQKESFEVIYQIFNYIEACLHSKFREIQMGAINVIYGLIDSPYWQENPQLRNRLGIRSNITLELNGKYHGHIIFNDIWGSRKRGKI